MSIQYGLPLRGSATLLTAEMCFVNGTAHFWVIENEFRVCKEVLLYQSGFKCIRGRGVGFLGATSCQYK